MEPEDEEELVKEQENEETLELANVMIDMDISWEHQKANEREQADKERSRGSRQEGVNDAERGSRGGKRRKYALLGEDWGDAPMEEGGEDSMEPGSRFPPWCL